MTRNLFIEVFNFLKFRIHQGSKLLLAFSGGPDSTALLHLLLEAQKKLSFELELAHVDHGQRIESTQEALKLQKRAIQLKLPFHLKTLRSPIEGNLEDYFRKERYQFFQHLYKERGCHALLLGHQKDDLEETVLKRFFEGAQFEKLTGMRSESSIFGMSLWRPLLDVSKEEILTWLEERKLGFIEDYTNQDERFLRARMRMSLIDTIERGFGKNIRSNLVKSSRSASLLRNYLEWQTKDLLNFQEGPFGTFIDFSLKNWHPYEIQFALRQIFESKNLFLSSDQIHHFTDQVVQNCANRRSQIASINILIDRKRLFILSQTPLLAEFPSYDLKLGIQQAGPWEVELFEKKEKSSPSLGFHQLFMKRPQFRIELPLGSYRLKVPCLKDGRFVFGKKISNWFSSHKVPLPFQTLLPVIEQDAGIFTELLTGKTPYSVQSRALNLILTYKKD